jgi:hypothetical protein
MPFAERMLALGEGLESGSVGFVAHDARSSLSSIQIT